MPIQNVRTVISVHDLMPEDFLSVKEMKDLDKNFATGRPVALVLRTEQATFSEADLCVLKAWISNQLFEDPNLINASSPFDLKKVVDQPGYLHYRSLLDLNCEAPSVLPDMKYWNVLRSSPLVNLFVARSDPKFLTMELSYDGAVKDEAMGAFAPEKRIEIQASIEEALKKGGRKISVSLSGAGTYESFLVNGMRVYGWINILIAVFIVFSFRWLYRTWSSSAIYLALIGTGMIVTFGAVGLSGRPIDILSNSLFVMTAVAALQDFAFLTSAIRRGGLWESYRRLLVPSFFTSLTTMVGFGSLAVSDIASIKWFGIWAALAAFLEWVLLFLVLPAALTIWPRMAAWWRSSSTESKGIGHGLFFGLLRHRVIGKTGVALFFAVFPVGLASLFFLNVQDDPKRMLPSSHPFRLELDRLKSDLGWEFPVSIVFPIGRDLEVINEITRHAEKLPGVAAVESLGEIASWMGKDLSPEVADVVYRDAVFRGMTRRFQTSDGTGRIVLYLKSASLESVSVIKHAVETKICPQYECRLVGEVVAYADFVRSVSETLFESLTSGLVAVVLLIFALSFIRLDLTVFPYVAPRMIASLLWGPMAMLALLAGSQVSLNMVTLICASVVVGLTGDNAIQFLFARKTRSKADLLLALSDRTEGALVTAGLTAVSSLVFLVSYFDPPRVLGVLLFSCFLLSLIGDTFGLRLLMGDLKDPTKTDPEGKSLNRISGISAKNG
ncbi:MAG: hypothetical protein U1E10_13155 [Bdellovibrionales bacterium]|nr:hypothetical protein [Bdellovibrionales bacterium]